MSKYSSFKSHQLIMENWRKYLGEADESIQTQALRLDLPQFVQQINRNKEKVLGALGQGLKDQNKGDDAVPINQIAVRCSSLRPTQSEVVFSKSIPFALQRPEVFMKYFTSDGPFKVGPPGNDAIITLNGRYILDGHHRWSSLFCVNPKAELYAFNIELQVNPITALKLVQASIGLYAGEAPSNKGGGVNLFTIDEKQLALEIQKLVTPQLANAYIKLGLGKSPEDSLAEDVTGGREDRRVRFITKKITGIYNRNVKAMQTNNRPAKGASNREPMPQTDKPAGSQVAAGGSTPKALVPLEKGMVDFRPPFGNKAAE